MIIPIQPARAIPASAETAPINITKRTTHSIPAHGIHTHSITVAPSNTRTAQTIPAHNTYAPAEPRP